MGIQCGSSGRGRRCWVKRRYRESPAESREKSVLWPMWRRKAEGLGDTMPLSASCRGREATLGASQPRKKAVAALLSGQRWDNWAVTGKCCRKIWEKSTWTGAWRQPEGKAGCWFAGEWFTQLCHAAFQRELCHLLTEQLPTMAASRGMEEGWGLGVPPRARSLLQHSGDCKCRSAFCSASFPALLFFSWLLLPLWCARISDGERRRDCCQGRALASWREAEDQSLKRQEIFRLPQENTTRKKVLKPPEVARAWEETQIPISEELVSRNDGKGIRKSELQAGVKTMTKDVGESDEVEGTNGIWIPAFLRNSVKTQGCKAKERNKEVLLWGCSPGSGEGPGA